jgi:hypothetical protein
MQGPYAQQWQWRLTARMRHPRLQVDHGQGAGKLAAVCEDPPIFHPHPLRRPTSPPYRLCQIVLPRLGPDRLVKPANCLLIALPHAGLRGDHRDDADDLRLHRQPVGIEPIGRPGWVFAYAVETQAEKMLHLLGIRPAVPVRRPRGAGDSRQAGKGYDGLAREGKQPVHPISGSRR